MKNKNGVPTATDAVPPQAGDPGAVSQVASPAGLVQPYRTIVKVLAVACALFVIVSGIRGTIFPYLHRAVFLGFILPIVFLKYPMNRRRKTPKTRPTVLDIVLSLIALSAVVIAWVNIDRILWRTPFLDRVFPIDIYMGVALILCVLEACRRVLGWALVIITAVFLAYALFGRNLPGMFAHAGVSYRRLIEYLVLMYDGLFSSITGIGSTFLFAFIAFGTILSLTGLSDAIFTIAKSVTRNAIGAPAKIAVIASGLMASISGSSIANVATTGAITIPMMKRAGFRSHEAAAFETAASAGGQIMPPIMGSGVFIMAELTGIPLIRLLGLSVLPALLYYLSVYVFVNNRSLLRHSMGELKDEPQEAPPSILEVVKKKGLLFVPIIFLLVMMLRGFSPYLSASLSIILLLIATSIQKANRMTIKQIISALEKATYAALTVSAIIACAAIVVGVIFQTGFVIIASSAILRLSQGNLVLMIILTIAMSYVVGMALPITVSYIIISILGVPAFVELGVPLIAAHMAIFWFSQDSTITPPVCMTAFIAADLAEAPRYKTGFTALMFAKGLYIIPFLFIFSGLLTDSFLVRITDSVIIGLGLIGTAIAFDGFWKKPLNVVLRVLAAAGAILLYYAATRQVLAGDGLLMLGAGVLILGFILFRDRIFPSRKPAQ